MAVAGGDWGIEAVSMRNPDLGTILNEQGGEFRLIERHPNGVVLRQIRSIKGALSLPKSPEFVAERIADISVSIVTITVTEKGYCADLVERQLDMDHPQIKADLLNPLKAQSVVGVLVAGLAKRRQIEYSGLTVISCDNLTGNGDLLKALVLQFARLLDKDLEQWIAANCSFPNSMVDRITPASTEATFDLVYKNTGFKDRAAVETEPFKQWVIEDKFVGSRPAWEAVGVEFVEDVKPFEKMKLRLLNGSHSLLAYLGCLGDYECVRDIMQDRALSGLIQRHMEAAAKTLQDGLEDTVDAYIPAIIERFTNPAIAHHCAQIAVDGTQKLPQRIFAPALECADHGHGVSTFALAVAAWLRFANGQSDSGVKLELCDPLAKEIKQALGSGQYSALETIQRVSFIDGFEHFGLLNHNRFQQEVCQWLELLRDYGALGTVSRFLEIKDKV